MTQKNDFRVSEILVRAMQVYRTFKRNPAEPLTDNELVCVYPSVGLAGPANALDGIVVGKAEIVKADTVCTKTGVFRLRNATGSNAITLHDLNKRCRIVDSVTVGNDTCLAPVAGIVLNVEADYVDVLVGLEQQ